jgi:hypothetical protein
MPLSQQLQQLESLESSFSPKSYGRNINPSSSMCHVYSFPQAVKTRLEVIVDRVATANSLCNTALALSGAS